MSTPPWWVLLIAAVLGGGGIAALMTVFTIPATRRKLDSGATLEVSQAAATLAQEYRLNTELARKEMDELRASVRKLTAEVEEERTRRLVAEARLAAVTGAARPEPPDPPEPAGAS